MKLFQKNIFTSLSVSKGEPLELIDVFDIPGKKIIELSPQSNLTYLIVSSIGDLDIEIITTWEYCSCTIFWLFMSNTTHHLTASITVSLKHSHTSANVDLISFLRDGTKIAIDGSIDIWTHLDQVHGRLLEQNIVLGQNISLSTLPKLDVASHNVTAAHGAKIDTFDQQKLFYMMSRGLTKEQSETLLVEWYIHYVLDHFSEITDAEKNSVYKRLT